MYNHVMRVLSNGSFFFGSFLFFAYMAAKAPLLLWEAVDLAMPEFFVAVVFLATLTVCAGALLLFFKKGYACCFVVLFNILFFLSLLVGGFNSFGFFKYASLSILLSLTALAYCLLPNKHRLEDVLLTFSALLALYGISAVLWGVINGQQFALRESIGMNGPIVFGQMMVISCAIILMYGDRRVMVASVPAMLSLLSFSKGPILAGLCIFFLKRKIFFVAMMVFAITVLLMLPGELLDNRFFNFVSSLYEAVKEGDTSVLFSGSNYGSIGSRLEQYVVALNLLEEYPMGIGVGHWIFFSEHDYPHNFLVELLVEQGLVVGLASLLLVLFFFTKIHDRNLRYLALMFLLFSMFSGSVIDNRGIYLMVLIGLLYRQPLN
jgi:hypothetical protein